MDHGDQMTINDEACTAVSARYELQNNEARDGFECNDEASDGDCGISQCKECLKKIFFSKIIIFQVISRAKIMFFEYILNHG